MLVSQQYPDQNPIQMRGVQSGAAPANLEQPARSASSDKFIKGDNKGARALAEGLNKTAGLTFGLAIAAGVLALASGPAGWVALGLLALTATCLLLRHAVQKQAGMETDFMANLKIPLAILAECCQAIPLVLS